MLVVDDDTAEPGDHRDRLMGCYSVATTAVFASLKAPGFVEIDYYL